MTVMKVAVAAKVRSLSFAEGNDESPVPINISPLCGDELVSDF